MADIYFPFRARSSSLEAGEAGASCGLPAGLTLDAVFPLFALYSLFLVSAKPNTSLQS